MTSDNSGMCLAFYETAATFETSRRLKIISCLWMSNDGAFAFEVSLNPSKAMNDSTEGQLVSFRSFLNTLFFI